MKEIRISPHIHSNETTEKIMTSVIVALIPALIGSVYFFGIYALKIVFVSIVSCVLSETLSQVIFRKKIRIFDGSAVVTGILFAFVLPPRLPLWMVALGGFFATDYVTSPLTGKGKIIFGTGCGIITFLIRLKGGYPEGVCYSILFMNMLVPLIDKYTLPGKFGGRK